MHFNHNGIFMHYEWGVLLSIKVVLTKLRFVRAIYITCTCLNDRSAALDECCALCVPCVSTAAWSSSCHPCLVATTVTSAIARATRVARTAAHLHVTAQTSPAQRATVITTVSVYSYCRLASMNIHLVRSQYGLCWSCRLYFAGTCI